MKETIVEAVYRQKAAWEANDTEAILADFAPDCVFITPNSRYESLDALREMVERYTKTDAQAYITVHRIIVEGSQCAVEWTWQETRTSGKQVTADDAIILEFSEGKIIYWREYLNPDDMKG